MMTFLETLIAFISAGLGSFVAVSLSVSHKQLCILISFAAGILLGVTVFHIIPEVWNLVPSWSIFLSLASGYALFYFLSRYVSHVCPACAATHFEDKTVEQFKSMAVLLALALSIHSAMDGIAISLGHDFLEKRNPSIFLSICIHKFPEGLALASLLLRAGYEKTKALGWSILMETSTMVGWLIGVFFLKEFQAQLLIDLILVHIGGGFIYLALHAILNESEEHSPRFIIICFLAGLIFMGLVR